jgi:hypothetical protein
MRSVILGLILCGLPLAQAADDPAKAEYDRMTKGAVPREQLLPLVPQKLAGFARTDLLDYPFSSSAAYKLDGGRYANLDLQNTFLRGSGDSSLVDLARRMCPKTEKVNGFDACVRIEPGRASLHWYLPDRLTVDLSSPDEALTRKMAAELPLKDLARLSAAK